MKVCECNDGWTGQNCSQKVTVCNSMPCMNGGTCEVSISENITYYCVCPEEYTGKHCQESIDNRDSGIMNHYDDDVSGDGDGESAETSTGGIVGGVVAGILLIIAIALVVCFIIYKRRKRNETTDNQTDDNESMHHHNVTYEDKLTFTAVTMTTNDVTDGATQRKESDVYYSSIGDPHKQNDYTVADVTKQGNGGHHPAQPEIQQRMDNRSTEDGFVDNIAYETADDVAELDADGGKGSNEGEGFVENVAYEGL
ncbi:delta-like protein A [Ptychodera flava]|uniref:delta-like protein A n=1 Tax=Ptychodera flava TaxID=63121 RepID=UPI00396A2129